MHPDPHPNHPDFNDPDFQKLNAEHYAKYWNNAAQNKLKEHLQTRINTNKAKNVIMFLGDGMSLPTVAAARIYKGQLEGELGEQSHLSFETFPFTGLSQTYCVDQQVADSACSATAYLCGVKANEGTIGITAAVDRYDCEGMTDASHHVDSIAKWAQDNNRSTGVVTTTRITHASPAGIYAHTSNRDWESDADVIKDGHDPKVCKDIATQLITGRLGKNLKVIMGGGRKEFLPKEVVDEEGYSGDRVDGINLIDSWQLQKQSQKLNYKYVWNRTDLLETKYDDNLDVLLGLFESDHCKYNLDADPKKDPTLSEMTESAINILSKNDNGYFLFVEGGRIDHGHHSTLAHKALDETVELSKAVKRAVELVNLNDTLIVVTSDHAHTMSFVGYPARGQNILSIAGRDKEKLPYTTLSYANGPGYKPVGKNGKRYDISNDNTLHKNYQFPSMNPMSSETHGGDDVGVFAIGPWAHLFTGVYEQNTIPHLMGFASCLGSGLTACDIYNYV